MSEKVKKKKALVGSSINYYQVNKKMQLTSGLKNIKLPALRSSFLTLPSMSPSSSPPLITLMTT